MPKLVALLIAGCGLLLAMPAGAEEPDVLAPFRFNPAPKEMSAVDRERAFAYRTQVESQLRDLEHEEALGRLDPLARRRLLETRGEASRMGRVTGLRPGSPPANIPLLLPNSLPSMSR